MAVYSDYGFSLKSPNFPLNYNENEDIKWNLQASEEGSVIKVTVQQFNVRSIPLRFQ